MFRVLSRAARTEHFVTRVRVLGGSLNEYSNTRQKPEADKGCGAMWAADQTHIKPTASPSIDIH